MGGTSAGAIRAPYIGVGNMAISPHTHQGRVRGANGADDARQIGGAEEPSGGPPHSPASEAPATPAAGGDGRAAPKKAGATAATAAATVRRA